MKILFYSVKGGQGKTTHAISYAKYKDALYLTNDYESGTINIYSDMFFENQLQIIKPDTFIDKSFFDKSIDVVFDFGGWVDEKIKKIAKNVDVIVVPIYYQSIADIMPCIKTVSSIAEFNDNIIILINNTETADIEDLRDELKNKFNNFKIFSVNRSKYMNRLANEGKTIIDLLNDGGIAEYQITKSGLKDQILNLYIYLEGIYGKI